MLMGIDIGTTHSKVGVYSFEGKLVAHNKALTPKEKTSEGYEHYLPDAMWETASGLIRNTIQQVDGDVHALAIASMGEAGVPLDGNGHPTYPIIPWNDTRNTAQMQRLSDMLEPQQWYAITGLYPNAIHSISKWLWLKENAPEAWQKTKLWLSTMGFIRYRLTGEAAMEASQAARTMAYNVTQHYWAEDVLERVQLSASFLPPLVHGTDQVGTVTQEAAIWTGLTAGTPVFAGGHDHICAALACGALTPDIALDSLGTAEGLTFGLAQRPDSSQAGGFGLGPHVIAGYSYLIGGIYSSGGAIRWIKELLGIESYDRLLELASQVPPATSPLYLAHFFGEAPPFNDANADGAFLNIQPNHDQRHFARAVYEGIAFEIRRHIEVFETLMGQAVNIIRVVGTSAENALWLKIRASVMGREIELPKNTDMVTLGAALLAGIGLGIYKDPQDALRRTYHKDKIYVPDPDWQAAYADRYATYKQITQTLHDSRKEG